MTPARTVYQYEATWEPYEIWLARRELQDGYGPGRAGEFAIANERQALAVSPIGDALSTMLDFAETPVRVGGGQVTPTPSERVSRRRDTQRTVAPFPPLICWSAASCAFYVRERGLRIGPFDTWWEAENLARRLMDGDRMAAWEADHPLEERRINDRFASWLEGASA